MLAVPNHVKSADAKHRMFVSEKWQVVSERKKKITRVTKQNTTCMEFCAAPGTFEYWQETFGKNWNVFEILADKHVRSKNQEI